MSEDMWHVEIEPGDVKVVTLEQMDDMYRLDLIQGSTQVWQEGMPRALPLSVVAGLGEEEEEEEIMEIEPEPLDSAPILNLAAPVVSSAPPPPRSTITPPPSSSVVVNQAPPAPALPSPDFYSPQSLRPITMSGVPNAPASTGTAGRFVMVLAVAAGLAVTLYRNDLLLAAAKSAGSEAAYASVESAVGQPGFGTTRSVEQLAALIVPPEPESVATAAAPAPATAPPSETGATQPAESSTESKPDPAAATKKEDPAPRAKSPATTSHVKPRRAPRASKKAVKGFKGSEYDPMNASL